MCASCCAHLILLHFSTFIIFSNMISSTILLYIKYNSTVNVRKNCHSFLCLNVGLFQT
jgi:hypothetical protein